MQSVNENSAGFGSQGIVGFAAMTVGMFMAILDIQIVASSLQEIQSGISASRDEVSWVQTSYLIAEVIIIPLSGFLTRLMSTRLLFVCSCLGFTVASALCATADSIQAMIFFRALQGFVGGAMIPLVFATIYTAFKAEHRNIVSMVVGMVAMTAPTLGPSLGGLISDALGWQWLFLVNVIPGLVAAATAFLAVDFDRSDWNLLKRLDLVGAALLAIALGSLQYVLEEGPRKQWFEDDSILMLSFISLAMIVLFIAHVTVRVQPIVDLRALRRSAFSIGCFYSFVVGIGLYGSVYVLPLFLARVRHFSALDIGLVMLISGIAQFASAPLATYLTKIVDQRVVLFCGLLLFALGAYLQSHLSAEWSSAEFFYALCMRGISLMLMFIPVNNMALGNLAAEEVANASGLYNLMRNLGGAIGIAGINTLMVERLGVHWESLREQITAGRVAVDGVLLHGSAHLSDKLSGDTEVSTIELLNRLTFREAQVLTFADVQFCLMLLFCGSMLLLLLLARALPGSGNAAAH